MKGGRELIVGLTAIVTGGLLAWGIASHRRIEAAWYSYRFKTVDKNASLVYLRKLVGLGPAGNSHLREIIVFPSALSYEEKWSREADCAKHVRQIRNTRHQRVCLILLPMDRAEAEEYKKSPSSWASARLEHIVNSDILDPDEVVPVEAPPDGR
jgi:hypothetical protein